MEAGVVIVGGGVVGSSIAYHLLRQGVRGPVVIVERDPSYHRASSNLAMGGVRQLFGSPANVSLARFSVDFYARMDELLLAAEAGVRVDFRQRGYLFLVDGPNQARFEERLSAHRRAGARVECLTRDDVRARLPDLMLDDIAWAMLGPEDGYLQPKQVLAGFQALARSAGALEVHGTVTAIEQDGRRVLGIRLGDGDESIRAPFIVNAAGPQAAQVAALVGIDLPVAPVRQHLFCARLPRRWPYRFPMLVDPTGVHWRHDDPVGERSDRIVVARTDHAEPPGENFAVEAQRWDEEIIPILLRRLPSVDGVSLLRATAGLYEMTPDHNPVLGFHPDLEGFILANGFSGHGLMLAPATGLAIAELVCGDSSRTFDISVFAPDRFQRGAHLDDAPMI